MRRRSGVLVTAMAVGAASVLTAVVGGASPPAQAAATATRGGTSTSTHRLLRQLAVASPHRQGFAPWRFGGWTTPAGSACSTRVLVLTSESISGSGGPCTLMPRTWHSPYDGRRVTRAGQMTVDHLVGLRSAWQSGAWAWSEESAAAYANDLGYGPSLLAVSRQSAAARNGRDPQHWLPAHAAYRCRYLAQWVAVKWRWDLTVSPAERQLLRRHLRRCGWPSVAAPTRVATTTAPAGQALDVGTNAGHSGVSDEQVLTSPLRLLWTAHSVRLPGAGDNEGQDPIVVDGVVYTFDEEYMGDVLSARLVATGRRIWPDVVFTELGRGSLAYGDHRLIVALDSDVVAIDPLTGKMEWVQDSALTSASAVVVGHVVYSGNAELDARTGTALADVDLPAFAQGPNGAAFGDGDWFVAAFDALGRFDPTTYAEQWQADPPQDVDWCCNVLPVIDDQYVVVPRRLESTTVYSADTGAFVRSLPEASTPPVLDGSIAYVTDDSSVSAVDLGTGRTLWSTTLPYIAMSPTLANGYLYVATFESTSGPPTLEVLNAETGAEVWSADAPVPSCGFNTYDAYQRSFPTIAVAEDRVFVPMDCGIAVYGPA